MRRFFHVASRKPSGGPGSEDVRPGTREIERGLFSRVPCSQIVQQEAAFKSLPETEAAAGLRRHDGFRVLLATSGADASRARAAILPRKAVA